MSEDKHLLNRSNEYSEYGGTQEPQLQVSVRMPDAHDGVEVVVKDEQLPQEEFCGVSLS